MFTGCTAKVHGRANFAVWMHAYLSSRILAGQGACRHAAVPVCNGALPLIHRDGISEKYGLSRQAAADIHRQSAVDV